MKTMMMMTTTLNLERPLRLPVPRYNRTTSRNLSRQNKAKPTLTRLVTIEKAAIIIDNRLKVDVIATTTGTDIMTEEIEALGKEATDTTTSLRVAMETSITTETVIITETSTAGMMDLASLENPESRSTTTLTTGSTIATTPLSS